MCELPPDETFKNAARVIYETAEWGPKREWETLPESAKLTWIIAAKRAYMAAHQVAQLAWKLQQH